MRIMSDYCMVICIHPFSVGKFWNITLFLEFVGDLDRKCEKAQFLTKRDEIACSSINNSKINLGS